MARCWQQTISGLLSCLILTFVLKVACAQESTAPFLSHPDIHGDRVVFTSEGDLWLGSIEAHSAQRLTSHPGIERNAHFSPDGSLLAFTGAYDGGIDVYVMPVQGGEPKRLTYDPSGALVLGWTPDGKYILYRSRRLSAERKNQLLRVPVAGGMPEALPIPQVEHAAMNPDGHRVAYVPVSAEWQHWFHYRGGQADDIWLTDTSTKTFRRLTDNPAIDTTPVWAGNDLYFVSERDGLANLYRLDLKSGKATAVTHYTDYGIQYPASDGKRILYQHDHGVAMYDPALNKATELRFELHSDRIHAREKRVPILRNLNSVAVGPTGKRILVEARGQLMSVPVENGDARLLAAQPGSRQEWPAWSPDGKQVAFLSDQSGEEQIWLAPALGSGEPHQLTHDHKGPLHRLQWSPDGKYLATTDREQRILLVDAASGNITLVDQTSVGSSYDDVNDSYRFSPDGKWLAFNRVEPNHNSRVVLYELATSKKTMLTSGEMNAYAPAFDSTGKYLVYLSDREFDPKTSGSSHYFYTEKTTKVNLLTLAADTPSPFLLTNDEEGEPDKTPATPKPTSSSGTSVSSALPAVKLDTAGLEERIVDVPAPSGNYQAVEMVGDRILLINTENGVPTLLAFDIKKKQMTSLMPGVSQFEVSADRKKLLVRAGTNVMVVDVNSGPLSAGGAGTVNLTPLTLTVAPAQEWRQIFREAWRLGRDFFYDPNLHGVDWEAVRKKYEAQLPAVADRSDLNRILGDMIAELNTGHAYVGGGDMGEMSPSLPQGFLGADMEPDPSGKAYRLVRLLGGDEFDLQSRSPLLSPGINVKPGDYIVAVAGKPVRTDQDIQALLVGTAGQVLTVSVNSKPTLEGARDVRIRPLNGGQENKARYYEWVKSRREYVRTHGGENLGYLHIPDMGEGGLQEFTKHYYAQLNQDGIVYDVRNNGGGYISSLLLLQMASKPFAYFKPRYGSSWTRQDWGFAGYAVTLCNQNSGSNAEEFCDAFQRLKLGPVIGTRTWGGEVGSGGGYSLVDGGKLFIPNYGEWAPESTDGKSGKDGKDGKGSRWLIEGTGAQPDEVVEQDPAAIMAGSDPQLDRAIAYLKEQIAKKPVPRPEPPAFPNKAVPARKEKSK